MPILLRSQLGARGMALVAVLWIVAALGIAVTGLTRLAKDEIRHASLDRSVLVATASADAAIRLVLQDHSAKPASDVSPNWSGRVEFEGREIFVQTQSLSGLIDINNAPEALLTDLFRYADSTSVAEATLLAQNIVQARTRLHSTGQRAGFDAPEDLLQVPGITYDIYSEIKSLVTASLSGGGRVDPMAAPLGVLVVLANGNRTLANKIDMARASGNWQLDTTQLNQNFIEKSSNRILNITATIMVTDNVKLDRVWWVGTGSVNSGKSPWRLMNSSKSVSIVQGK